MNISSRFAILTATLVFSLPVFSLPVAVAQDLYKSIDKQGKVIYSSKPPEKGAKPAKLPPITRGEVKVPASALVSCAEHAGIDCQAGPDEDGSVICSDGFRDSAQRFRFSCSAPKLEITKISEPDGSGAFTVFLRNSKSVAAINPVVKFKPADGQEVGLSGPALIEPFGAGEFVSPATDTVISGIPIAAPGAPFGTKPGLENIIVSCDNCPG